MSDLGPSAYYGDDEPTNVPPPDEFGSDLWHERVLAAPTAVGRSRRHAEPASIVVHLRTPWPVRALVVVLFVALAGLTAALTLTRKHGNNWMVEARNLEQLVTDGEAAAREVAESLEAAQELLARSEADVTRLETRLNALADEKAQAKDEAAAANVNSSYLFEITQAAAAVTDRMNSCIAYQDEWSAVLVDILNGYSYDRWRVEQFAREVDATCEDAQYLAFQLQSLVNGL